MVLSAPPLPIPSVDVLFESPRVRMTMQTHKPASDEEVNHVCIEALDETASIDDITVEGVLNCTIALLDSKTEFQTLWDIRKCTIPNVGLVCRLVRWAIAEKGRLDQHNKRLCIVLPTSRGPLPSVVKIVLRAFGPKCPVFVTTDLPSANEFMKTATPSESTRLRLS